METKRKTDYRDKKITKEEGYPLGSANIYVPTCPLFYRKCRFSSMRKSQKKEAIGEKAQVKILM
ncbi:MAG: hypothetical protein A2Z51_03890 [Deltaproteobacteria bacterium RBG_19FT_COMBO_52_11]|nr:MAG: hypothetical protein A2Z51_03890 [Deltaproteobacteria bacterium RBG_19FT_COMBO_52_11]